jgi:spermidine/putrescine transport system substrate-binding protein
MNEGTDRPHRDEALMEAMMRARLTRRGLFKGAGRGAAALGLGAFLAACASSDEGSEAAFDPAQIFGAQPGDKINFANWPLYIDYTKDKDGNRYIPSLRAFTKQTGIEVNFQEAVQSNPEFFGKLQPQLQAGQDTGWDIIVITNGRYFTALVENEWVYPLDPTKHPNFDKHAANWAKDPTYDPNNEHSMAWQSGFTGFGVNSELVKGTVTKLDDLANPDKVGTGLVGMLKEDMPDFVMINMGIDPTTSGPAEWKEAADWMLMQRDAGVIRQYYDQGYIDDLTAGNLSATMAWSGDVLYYKTWAGYDNLDWNFPEGGALHWVDNMLVPAEAANPAGAIQLMDYYYQPRVAADVTEWVLYLSPVPATQDLILKDAKANEAQNYKGYANKLFATAENPFMYPDDSLLARTSYGRELKTDDEREEWDAIFLPISQG